MTSPAKPVGPYTPIVRAGDWLVVSGQIALADGKLASGGVAGDFRQARSAIGVAELPLGALVEVEAWAWVGG
jgi:2-iminobutanoate/2-iminopropanoate deaminase